jgi:AraC-like DNA-binding protein
MKEPTPGVELKVYGQLFSLLYQLYNEDCIVPAVKSARTHQTETVAKLLDWIEKNYTEPITLEKLAEISGLSAKYLCRIFKEYTSKTVIRYVNELRINHACHEMASGKNSTQAAFDSGFNDLSYFSKTFRIHKGKTPRQYRTEYNRENEKQ